MLGESVGLLVILAVLLALPTLGASNRIQYLAVVCLIWAVVTYGLFIPFALAGQMTMAMITVWGVSSFSVALAANHWGWNLGRLIPLGVIAGFAAGAICSLPVLRTSGHYFIVVTFAIVQLGVMVGMNWSLIDPLHSGLPIAVRPELFGWHLERRADMLWLSVAFVVVAFAIVAALRHSGLGGRFAAVRENEALAATVGAPVKVLKCLALSIGGAVVGMAAPLQVFFSKHIQIADFGMTAGITIVVLLVLGGRTYLLGPLFGALFWYMVPELIGLDAVLAQAVFGLLLALVIIVSPAGLVAGLVSLARLGIAAVRRVDRSSPGVAERSRGRGGGRTDGEWQRCCLRSNG